MRASDEALELDPSLLAQTTDNSSTTMVDDDGPQDLAAKDDSAGSVAMDVDTSNDVDVLVRADAAVVVTSEGSPVNFFWSVVTSCVKSAAKCALFEEVGIIRI